MRLSQETTARTPKRFPRFDIALYQIMAPSMCGGALRANLYPNFANLRSSDGSLYRPNRILKRLFTMGLSDEQVRALADTVTMWRLQEYTESRFMLYYRIRQVDPPSVPFCALYIYYVLTTLDEEVAVILPQKWNRGKMLFMITRYGTLIYVSLHLPRDFRNYFVATPVMCKIWVVICNAIYYLYTCACDAALALCLGALLRVRGLYLAGIMVISTGPRIVTAIINSIGYVQYPGAVQCHIFSLFKELGYPCYAPSAGQMAKRTIIPLGVDIRAYITFSTTAVLFLLAGVALIVRYQGHNGRLVQVLRRDGGLYYIALAGIRFGLAITRTPAILAISEMDSNPGAMVIHVYVVCHVPSQQMAQ
ncbi:hypothetical protein NMY22_g1375 [Coprinellus aureogranulatus]|nr:hypothetical protein NMY22_g1375 [Coprinellus aureogranulatus]